MQFPEYFYLLYYFKNFLNYDMYFVCTFRFNKIYFNLQNINDNVPQWKLKKFISHSDHIYIFHLYKTHI